MERDGDVGREFGAGYEGGRCETGAVFAVKRAGEGVEGKVDGEMGPRRLFDGAEAGFGGVAERGAGGRRDAARIGIHDRNAEKGFVRKRRDVEAEAAKIVGEEGGAADFGSDGVAESVGEGQAEGERRELVEVGDEAPAVW